MSRNRNTSSDSDSESETDSLDMTQLETGTDIEIPEEEQEQLASVRSAVRDWKLNELNKNTTPQSNVKSLQSLRTYVANAGRMYYDLLNYLKTSQNKEQNMKNTLYVNIVSSIGPPGSLSYPVKVLLESILERDLVELPYTLEPTLTNSYAEKGIRAQKEFPEEE